MAEYTKIDLNNIKKISSFFVRLSAKVTFGSKQRVNNYMALLLIKECVENKKDLVMEYSENKGSKTYLINSNGDKESLIPVPADLISGIFDGLENLVCTGQDIYTTFCGENQTLRIHKTLTNSYRQIKLENLTK